MKKLKILFIQHTGSMGGSAMSLYYLVEALVEKGHEVEILLARPSEPLSSLYSPLGVKVYKGPRLALLEHTSGGTVMFWQPRAVFNFVKSLLSVKKSIAFVEDIVARSSPDVVHLNSVVLFNYAVIKSRFGVLQKIVWHIREAPETGHLGIRFRFMRHRLLNSASELIFLSLADREAWVSGRRGIVLPNSLGKSARERAMSLTTKKFNAEFTVLYVGGLSEIKGFHILVDALRILSRSGTRYRLLLPNVLRQNGQSLKDRTRQWLGSIGFSWGADRLAGLLKDPNIAAIIECDHFKNDLRPYFERSNILVFPSTQPHFARPVVEAAFHGVPSIVSRLSGVMDLVNHGVSGLIVPAGDASALAGAIAEMAMSVERCEMMGVNARASAIERFSHETLVDTVLETYNKAVNCPADSEKNA